MIKKGGVNIFILSKTAFKKLSTITINFFFLSYVAFSILTLSGCYKENEKLSYEQQIEKRGHAIKLLEEKFGALLLNSNLEQSIGKVVILDTLVLGIRKEADDFIIRAKINNNSRKKCFTELKCSKEIAEHFNKTKSNYNILAAKISKIYDYKLIAETDSLSGENPQLDLGNSVLLTGECLALMEVPAIINAN